LKYRRKQGVVDKAPELAQLLKEKEEGEKRGKKRKMYMLNPLCIKFFFHSSTPLNEPQMASLAARVSLLALQWVTEHFCLLCI
jgi:hypothetical protein